MSPVDAINVFTKLTIGDGLVSQVPAFLISLAAGLIVTRSSSSTDLNRDVVGQMFSRPGVLGTAAAFLGFMAFTPLPKLPLLALGGGLGAGAILLGLRRDDDDQLENPHAAIEPAAPGPRGRAAATGSPSPAALTKASGAVKRRFRRGDRAVRIGLGAF